MLLETLGKIGFDYKLALANAVNFVVIFFLLKRYFFGPIGKAIEERRLKNEESLILESKAKTVFENATKKEQEILTEAHHKARKIMEKAESKGEEIIEHLKNEALKEKQRIIDEGLEEVNKKEKEVRSKIEEDVSELIVMSAEKLIKSEIDPKTKVNYLEKITKKV